MSEPDRTTVPETGDPRVDGALRSLEDLDAVPVDEHAERLSAAHATLQEVLRTPAEPDSGTSSERRP